MGLRRDRQGVRVRPRLDPASNNANACRSSACELCRPSPQRVHLSPAPRNPERQLEIPRSATFVVNMSAFGLEYQQLAHSCPERVRRHVRSWRKPTPHTKAHPLVNRLNLAAELRSLTNGLPSRTNVCTRRKRTCGPKEEVRVWTPNRTSTAVEPKSIQRPGRYGAPMTHPGPHHH
jgi:hypothetical protein